MSFYLFPRRRFSVLFFMLSDVAEESARYVNARVRICSGHDSSGIWQRTSGVVV